MSADAEHAMHRFSLSVAYILYLWPCLTLAVNESWGGEDSDDKRQWLAGSIVELFENDPTTEAIDVELRIIQVMEDEFGTSIDDGSPAEVAEGVLRMWGECGRGDFSGVEELRGRFERRGAGVSRGNEGFRRVETRDEDQETDGDESSDGEDDEAMGEAPPLVQAPRERAIPEVDEDGFTKVVSRRRQ